MGNDEEKRILVIDDDPVYRELLTIALTSEGYRVVLAENGESGQEVARREEVHAVVLDMLMPLMDGLSFLRWLRQEEQRDVPALVLTSMDKRDLSVEALVSGATDVLVKPVSLPLLLQKLEAVLNT